MLSNSIERKMQMLTVKNLEFIGQLGNGLISESNAPKGDLPLPESSNKPVDIDKLLEQEMTPSTTVEQVCSIEEIRAMINQLSMTEDGEPLKTAMQRLKKGIKDNPEACSLLLPEEIGEMVKNLYRMTDRDLEIATDKLNKRKPAKPKIDLSDAKTQQEILDDL
jgi:hypothetical protein